MSDDKVRVDLDDRVFGISGTVNPKDYFEPAKGVSEDHDLGYVKYKPALKTKNAIKAKVRNFFSFMPGVDSLKERRTPKAIPEEQIDLVYTPSDVTGKEDDQDLAGQPDRKLVIKQTEDGNAFYDDLVEERERNKLSQVTAEKNRAEGDALTSKAEAIDLESDDEEKENTQNQGLRPQDREVIQ